MQRNLRVVDLPDALVQSSSSSAANYSDEEQTKKFLSKLSQDVKGIQFDEYTERLKKGVFSRHAVSFENDKHQPNKAQLNIIDDTT